MSKAQTLQIALIHVPVKKRGSANPEKVRTIAESILEIGQQAPIVVRPDGDRCVLLDGLHRLEACKALGETTIVAQVQSHKVGRIVPRYENELEDIRQKTERLRQLRRAKEAAERQEQTSSPTRHPSAEPDIGKRGTRVRKKASLSEWLDTREHDGFRT